MKIRLHNSIVWKYQPIVKALIDKGYQWNIDMWGRKPLHDAIHLHFKDDAVYQDALKIQENLAEFSK